MSKPSETIKVYCDFNSGTDKEGFFILYYGDQPIADQINKLGLSNGSVITLYQEEGDFEVQAILRFEFIDILDRKDWIAYPNWETLKRN
jgi:hypothetical protein